MLPLTSYFRPTLALEDNDLCYVAISFSREIRSVPCRSHLAILPVCREREECESLRCIYACKREIKSDFTLLRNTFS